MSADRSIGRGMVIGVLIPEFPGPTHILFWREILRLRELGATVHVASTRRSAEPCPHDFAQEPCHYVWPPTGLAPRVPAARRIAEQIRFALGLPEGGWRERLRVLAMIPSSWSLAAWARAHGIEHLHIHSFANSAYLGALLRIGEGIPFSIVLHGDIEVYGLNHAAKLAQAAFACAVDTKLRATIDEVLPGVCLDRLSTCGVPVETFAAAEREPVPVLRLISVGRLNHCKGISFTLAALARLRGEVPLTYTLVGSGPDEDDLRREVSALGLDDIVTFLGPKGEAECAELLRRHDLAVLTSHGKGEASAIAIREAMMTGMPVIMSDIGEARNMIAPYETGLIVPQRDPDAIADAIRWFHTNRDRMPAMGAAARARAERDFSDWTAPRVLLDELVRRRSAKGAPAMAAGVGPSDFGNRPARPLAVSGKGNLAQ